jgi:hypothetical protein
MKLEYRYQSCGFCRYFLPWGKYEEGSSAADARTGKCRRYPPTVNFMYYPYFSKHFVNFMQSLGEVGNSSEPWADPEIAKEELTNLPGDKVIKLCSVLPYVEMDDFCGEYMPANPSQLRDIIDIFETHQIRTDDFQEALKLFEKMAAKAKKGQLF